MTRYTYIYIHLMLFYTLSGFGQNNTICSDAISINTGACTVGVMDNNSSFAIQGNCADSIFQSLWYKYDASENGILLIESKAKFNDEITVFTGSCSNPNMIQCINKDEYGFDGEKLFLDISAGTEYYIQLSNVKDEFSIINDSFCIQLSLVTNMPNEPTNDFCANAINIEIDGNEVVLSNNNATTGSTLPTNEERARSDIWFYFTASQEELKLVLKSDFSNVITLYDNCENQTQLSSTESGELVMTDLNIDEKYLVQVSGNFATIEGNGTLKLVTSMSDLNIDCVSTKPVYLNAPCVPFSNEQQTFSGIQPICEFGPAADLWFSFVAPSSNGVKVRTEADFLHSIALYEGECDSLNNVFCIRNPQSCLGYTEIENLREGQQYYLQIMSRKTSFGYFEGTGCLEIVDILQGGSFLPLSLNVDPFCLNINEAELQIEAVGGEGDIVFEGDQHGDVLANGDSYLVKVTDEKGCVQLKKGDVSCDVVGDCDIFYFLGTQPTSCYNESDGSAVIDVAEGADVQYAWSNGGSTNSISNLASGSYSVTITNSEDCSFDIQFKIQSPAPLLSTHSIINSSNDDASDGSISIVAMGGVPPYRYQWESGEDQVTLSNLIEGNYSYTITDSNDCTYAGSATVNVVLTCPQNQELTLDVESNVQECYSALEIINSTSKISSPAVITYKAGKRVILSDGFKAAEGSVFVAKIESCASDLDQDGYFSDEDCDDNNASINPGEIETPYNGIDDDCDPTTLDDDLDQDGFILAEDCDDTNPNVNSDAEEIAYNDIDDDCNSETLDDDLDQDGFVLAEDCDDTNPNINSDAEEIAYNGIDDDCNSETLDDDLDQDGFVIAEDCDDTNPNINSDAEEIIYNGIDDDCDPETLDDDLDQDGFNLIDDCNDTDESINPDAEEIPNNGIDEDCDGMDETTSIFEIGNTLINIYPNPAFSRINIDVQGQLNYQANLYDLEGKLIKTISNSNLIKVDTIISGIYLLEIKDIITGKRIVERIVIGN